MLSDKPLGKATPKNTDIFMTTVRERAEIHHISPVRVGKSTFLVNFTTALEFDNLKLAILEMPK